MRILFTCLHFEIGGFSSHALNLSRVFRAQGHQTCALVTEPFGQLHAAYCAQFDRVLVVRRGGLEGQAAFVRRMARALKAERPDVVINNAVPAVQAALPYLGEGVVTLSVVHSILKEEIALGASLVPYVDGVIAVSANIAEALTARGVPAEALMVIPVGINLPTEALPVAPLRQPLRLLSVGRFSHEKNLGTQLDIAEALHQAGMPFTLTMVGDGDDRPLVMERLANAPYAGQVVLPGAVAPDALHGLWEQHDLYLLTSTYEGTPHALLEAMAHGLVGIAARIPGSTDRLITDGVTGFLCDTHDTAAYVDVIRRLCATPALVQTVAEAGRASVREAYGILPIAQRYLAHMAACQMTRRPWRVDRLATAPTVAPAVAPLLLDAATQWRHRFGDCYRQYVRGITPAPFVTGRW